MDSVQVASTADESWEAGSGTNQLGLLLSDVYNSSLPLAWTTNYPSDRRHHKGVFVALIWL